MTQLRVGTDKKKHQTTEIVFATLFVFWMLLVLSLLSARAAMAVEKFQDFNTFVASISLANVGDFFGGMVAIPLLIYAIRAFRLQQIEFRSAIDALDGQSSQLSAQATALQLQTQLLSQQVELQTASERAKFTPKLQVQFEMEGPNPRWVHVVFNGFDAHDVMIEVKRPGANHGNGYPIVESGQPVLAALGEGRFDSETELAAPIFVRVNFRTVTGMAISRLYAAWRRDRPVSRIKDFTDEEIAEKLTHQIREQFATEVRGLPWC